MDRRMLGSQTLARSRGATSAGFLPDRRTSTNRTSHSSLSWSRHTQRPRQPRGLPPSPCPPMLPLSGPATSIRDGGLHAAHVLRHSPGGSASRPPSPPTATP